MNTIIAVTVLLVAVVAAYWLGKSRLGGLLYERDALQKENERLKANNEELQASNLERVRLQEKLEQSEARLVADAKRCEDEKQEREALYQKSFDQLRENFIQTKTDLEKQSRERMEAMKAEFQSLAAQVLKSQSEELEKSSQEGWKQLMSPLKEKMEAFEKAVQESKEKSVENTASLESSIKHLMDRSQEIGREAERLTGALKGDNKVQGDWGEMILSRLLELSGLRLGEEYSVQESVESTTGEGARMRPDVIVRFPEGRSVIIDSKVSLTAYVNYTAAATDEERALYLKKHLESMRKHVEELSGKDYTKTVKGAIGYVLMFVPNEASYILAVKNDDKLSADAYKKKIVVISPTNLIMALQLAYNLWQGERQSRNVEEIVKRASALYEKFATFTETFTDLGTIINRLQTKFDEGSKQLTQGRGNITKQFEDLRTLGLTPKNSTAAKLIDQMEA